VRAMITPAERDFASRLMGEERTERVFAYGSNLDVRQMLERCPSAVPLGAAVLPRVRLTFAGSSARWGGGVAGVELAPKASLHGVVYRVSSSDLLELDLYEGAPHVYMRVRSQPRYLATGRFDVAHVYILRRGISAKAPPGPLYVKMIERGYEHHGLPVRSLREAISRARATR
jgi:hypothetical protein